MTSKTYSLYLVEHRDSGRCYVGWASDPTQRWHSHKHRARNKPELHFHRALGKYGADAFDWAVVAHFDNADEAKHVEVYWIARLKEFGIELFNLSDGGEGLAGYQISEATRAKMRRPKSAEHRAKLSAANLGKPNPMQGRRHSEETRAKLRKPKSAEHRAKLSATNTGKPSAFKGRKHTEETKARLRQIALDRHKVRVASNVQFSAAGTSRSPNTSELGSSKHCVEHSNYTS